MRAGPLSDGISAPIGRDTRELEFSLSVCTHPGKAMRAHSEKVAL